jgi:hypothetical protein
MDEVLSVGLQSAPESPKAHTLWILSFLLDFPDPRAVTVYPPALPRNLILESIRIKPHRGESPETEEQKTLVELWFMPQQSGMLALGSFEVRTPAGLFQTESTTWYIQGETPQKYQPRCFWQNPPRSLGIGETGRADLVLKGWDRAKPWPNGALFLQELPAGALLEAEPLDAQDLQQGVVLRLAIVPVRGTEFVFPARWLPYENLTIEIPELRVPLFPVPPPAQAPTIDAEPSLSATEGPTGLPEFPRPAPPHFPWFRKTYTEALQEIQDLWNQRKTAEALRELRRYERESLVGAAFARLRRDAEQALFLTRTMDEPWRPRVLFQVLLGLGLFLVGLTVARLLLERVTSRTAQGYKGRIRGFILGAGLAFAAFAGLGMLDLSRSDRGVLRAGEAYRVPEAAGMVSASFRAGEAVRLRTVAEVWVYVEAFDGRLGWVPQDRVIRY